MNITLERLTLLSLSKKRPKNIFPDTGGAGYCTGDLACAPWFQQHSISPFFGKICIIAYITHKTKGNFIGSVTLLYSMEDIKEYQKY